MKRLSLIIIFTILIASVAFADGFNSLDPPYGQKLSEMKYGEYFVKYAQKGKVALYNYIGPRIPNPHYEISSPRITYGFINDRLYSCIYQNWDVPKKKIVDLINSAYNLLPKKSYDKGDWSIYVWYDPGRDIEYKLKFNNATMEVKCVFYYRPLKAVLDQE